MIARILFAICFACVAAECSGFILMSPSFQRSRVTVQSRHWLDAIDEMCLENSAEYCVEEECDVETKLALVNQLEDQRSLMADKVKELDVLVERLRASDVIITQERKAFLDSILENSDGGALQM